MIEQSAVAVLRGGEFVDKVGQHRDVILVDEGEVVHVGLVVRVMRGAVKAAAVPALREC
ncbi:hypothetical protein D3C83_303570 [compost metagenome]